MSPMKHACRFDQQLVIHRILNTEFWTIGFWGAHVLDFNPSNPAEVGSAAVRHRAFHVLPARVSIQSVTCWHPQILIIYDIVQRCSKHSIFGTPCPAWQNHFNKMACTNCFPHFQVCLTVIFHHYPFLFGDKLISHQDLVYSLISPFILIICLDFSTFPTILGSNAG